MFSIPDNVRQDFVTFVPSQLLKEITCFVFYVKHPRNKKCIDITVCTSRGELKEFYKRDLVSSIIIDSCWKPTNIQILRNKKCELFYLVSCEDEIAIISGREKLKVLHKICNVDTYEVNDLVCRGQACLKIIFKDDAVPLFFDNNFEKLGDRSEILIKENTEEALPIITQLASKLTEAKYSVMCNEKALRDLSGMRQLAAYSNLKKCSSRQDGAIYQEDKLNLSGPLKIKSQTALVKMCYKKLAIILEVISNDNLLVENVHILFHTPQASTVYKTKLFKATSDVPYWKENTSNTIDMNKYTAIVAVIDLEEIKYNISSKINLCGSISYKVGTKELLLPFDEINLSSLDTISESFNVLSNKQDSNKYTLLALLATAEKTELCLRHIKMDNEEDLQFNLLDEFCKNLGMEKVMDVSSLIVHKSSPYHILHGVMVIVEKNFIGENKWIVSLYTRSQDQVLAFIHFMYDVVPFKIVATSTNQQIKFKIPQLSNYDETTSVPSKYYVDCSELQSSMLKQTCMTLEYLDECMIKMNESKNPAVHNKMGREIDIFAGGVTAFQEFGRKIRKKVARGVDSIYICDGQTKGMVVDLD